MKANTPLPIAQLQAEAWATAEAKGFHEDIRTLNPRQAALIRLALIHTEVSEATQEVKRHGVDSAVIRKRIAHELADVLIRCGDLAEMLGLNLEEACRTVLATNRARPYKYGTPEQDEKGEPAL